MHEEFLSWIWKNRLFEQSGLQCTNGDALTIIHPGYLNPDSGPDFFQARIKIDGMIWAGNAELHVRSSDWLRHNHQFDPSYDTVILHVVYEDDCVIRRADGSALATLVLKGLFDNDRWINYLSLIQNATKWVACEGQLKDVPSLVTRQWLARIITERLEEKCRSLQSLLTQTKNDWETAFWRFLTRSFGFRVNNDPFEILAAAVPLKLINQHRLQPHYTEALLFGQAGFLERKPVDAYTSELRLHYQYLRKKCSLTPMPVHLWKFGRLRPANFPTLRIAQLASVIQTHEMLFSKLTSADFDAVIATLRTEPSGYWRRHYMFGDDVPEHQSVLGMDSAENLLVNAVIPMTFYYGQYYGRHELADKALNWLERCAAENNKITRGWNSIFLKANDALESQALLWLKQKYCDYKKCVNCGIGHYLLDHQ